LLQESGGKERRGWKVSKKDAAHLEEGRSPSERERVDFLQSPLG